MESKNKQQEKYIYSILSLFDEDGYEHEYYIDDLLDDALEDCTKVEKISFLNDIIRDVEHYRDTLE